MTRPKPPSPQELYRARKQREEQERNAYLPPGLINHGNTCFMNSVLQGLIATRLLSDLAHFSPIPPDVQTRSSTFLVSSRSPQLTNGHGIAGPHEQSPVDNMPVGDQFFSFMSRAWDVQSARQRVPLSPKLLLAVLGKKYQQYLDFAQQDAHEFLRILLDAMRMEELDVIKKRQPPPPPPPPNHGRSKRKRAVTSHKRKQRPAPLSPSSNSPIPGNDPPSPISPSPQIEIHDSESPYSPFYHSLTEATSSSHHPPSIPRLITTDSPQHSPSLSPSPIPSLSSSSSLQSPSTLRLLPLTDMVFCGQLTSILVCQKCKHVSQTFEDFYDISLSIKPEDYASASSSLTFPFASSPLSAFSSSLKRSVSSAGGTGTGTGQGPGGGKHERKRDKFRMLARKIAGFPEVVDVGTVVDARPAAEEGPGTNSAGAEVGLGIQRPSSVPPSQPRARADGIEGDVGGDNREGLRRRSLDHNNAGVRIEVGGGMKDVKYENGIEDEDRLKVEEAFMDTEGNGAGDVGKEETGREDTMAASAVASLSATGTTESASDWLVIKEGEAVEDKIDNAVRNKEKEKENKKKNKEDDTWVKIGKRISLTVAFTRALMDRDDDRDKGKAKEKEKEKSRETRAQDVTAIKERNRTISPDARVASSSDPLVNSTEQVRGTKVRPTSTPPTLSPPPIHLSPPPPSHHAHVIDGSAHHHHDRHRHRYSLPQERAGSSSLQPVLAAPIPKPAGLSPLSQPPYQPPTPRGTQDVTERPLPQLPPVPESVADSTSTHSQVSLAQTGPVQQSKLPKPSKTPVSSASEGDGEKKQPPFIPRYSWSPRRQRSKEKARVKYKLPKPTQAETEYLRRILADIDVSGSASSPTPPSGWPSTTSSSSTLTNPFALLMKSSAGHGWHLNHHHNHSHHRSGLGDPGSSSNGSGKNESLMGTGGSQVEKERRSQTLSSWLGINRPSGIEECLRMFTSVEVLDKENMVGCRRCWKMANGAGESQQVKREHDEEEGEDDGQKGEEDDGREEDSKSKSLERIDSQSAEEASKSSSSTLSESSLSSSLPTSEHIDNGHHDHNNQSQSQSLLGHPPIETPGGMPIPTISTTGPESPIESVYSPSRPRMPYTLRSNSADYISLSAVSSREEAPNTPGTLGRTASSPSITSTLVSPVSSPYPPSSFPFAPSPHLYTQLSGSPYIQPQQTDIDTKDLLVIPRAPFAHQGTRSEWTDIESDGESRSAVESHGGMDADDHDGGSSGSWSSFTAAPSAESSAPRSATSHEDDGKNQSAGPTELSPPPPTPTPAGAAGVTVSQVAGTDAGDTIDAGKASKPVIMSPAYKRYLIATPPPVLVIHLKRFQQMTKTPLISFTQSYGFRKVEDYVSFPEYLDLTPFLAPKREDFGLGRRAKEGEVKEEAVSGGKKQKSAGSRGKGEKCMYRLYAVVVHIGNMLGGHYVAYTAIPDQPPDHRDSHSGSPGAVPQTNSESAALANTSLSSTSASKYKSGKPERQWTCISDTSVRLATLEEVLKAKAYICMYERI
ncbi:hypothetical protein AX17_001726 [Amanita inopinata Kibby_2008]|nr:hypothetical protein AX17_001726 [Amanita inopinata Kibby_2008]